MTVELVYDKDCPNVKSTRMQIIHAFNQLNLTPKWSEWDHEDPECPKHLKGYGSPTILVDRKDVSEMKSNGNENCCRLYTDQDGRIKGVPSVEEIQSSLIKAMNTPKQGIISTGKNIFSVLPSIGLALLPKLTCPACWPAYAGILSSFGITFVNYTPYLFPLTAVFLIFALFTLFYKASSRRGYKPFLLGIVSTILVLMGKFLFSSDEIMYSGLVLLSISTIWNSIPIRKSDSSTCPACVSTGNPIPLSHER